MPTVIPSKAIVRISDCTNIQLPINNYIPLPESHYITQD
jgi:hypothetical protein